MQGFLSALVISRRERSDVPGFRRAERRSVVQVLYCRSLNNYTNMMAACIPDVAKNQIPQTYPYCTCSYRIIYPKHTSKCKIFQRATQESPPHVSGRANKRVHRVLDIPFIASEYGILRATGLYWLCCNSLLRSLLQNLQMSGGHDLFSRAYKYQDGLKGLAIPY